MTRLSSLTGLACLILCLCPAALADWDDYPGFDFHPQTSDAAPCGTGTPPRGHFTRETSPASLPNGLELTVKQDANRLCYVSGNIAEAPVIRIRQGAEMKITLRNEITDPAAIARYVAIAHLDAPNPAVANAADFYAVVPGMHHAATGMTNLHVHGFAVPPIVPQDEVLKTCVDPAVGPALCGRREFTYSYKVPDTMPAGLYWYHPHVHGEVQAQMLMGLSGAIVVEGPDDDARRAAGILDRIFIVRQAQDLDVKTAAPVAAAQVEAAPPEPMTEPPRPSPASNGANAVDTAHELACSSNTGVDEITLNGSKVLNGHVQDADLAHYEIAAGTTQLWRFLNAATDAFLDLVVVDENGKPRPIAVTARDGAPLTDDKGRRIRVAPTTEPQLIPPGGRMEFMIDAPPVEQKAYLITRAVDTGCAGDKVPERTLALITASQTAATPIAVHPVFEPSIPSQFSHLIDRKTDRERTIALAEYPRPGSADQTDFYIAERKPGMVLRPYEMGSAPAITVNGGTTEEWVVENWTNELHAFHMHQLHFRVLEVDGKKQPDPQLLDVVNVPYATPSDVTGATGPITPGRVRIKLYFPEELAGDIPFHCHLVDHEDNGMMAVLRILPRQASTGERKTELSPAELLANPPICRPKQTASAD
jgi:FtsP/CotA-like multicopper oxidase with cupredoxin domain